MVADIGCDHGLLPILCSGKCRFVIGVEKSRFAYVRAATATQHLSNVDILIGSGLIPLLNESRHRPDTVVLAGMGAYLMESILTECTGDAARPMSAVQLQQSSILNQIGTKRLILQPSPLQLSHELPLHRTLIDMGWDYYDQDIFMMKGRFYLTTCFIYSGADSGQSKNMNEVFMRLPMVKMRQMTYSSCQPKQNDLRLWRAFLCSQLSIMKKTQRAIMESRENYKLRLDMKQSSDGAVLHRNARTDQNNGSYPTRNSDISTLEKQKEDFFYEMLNNVTREINEIDVALNIL